MAVPKGISPLKTIGFSPKSESRLIAGGFLVFSEG